MVIIKKNISPSIYFTPRNIYTYKDRYSYTYKDRYSYTFTYVNIKNSYSPDNVAQTMDTHVIITIQYNTGIVPYSVLHHKFYIHFNWL